jgi:hypothetical protein
MLVQNVDVPIFTSLFPEKRTGYFEYVCKNRLVNVGGTRGYENMVFQQCITCDTVVCNVFISDCVIILAKVAVLPCK